MNKSCTEKLYELWEDLYSCSRTTLNFSQSLLCYDLVFENFGENYLNSDKVLKFVKVLNNSLETLYKKVKYLIESEKKSVRAFGYFLLPFSIYVFFLPLKILRDSISSFYSTIKLYESQKM